MFKSFAFVLLTFSSICLAGSGFEYGGLSLNSDPSTYKKRYPTSIVQGNSAWLSKADSHNGVHYIEKRSIDGKQEIKISFEAPEDQLDKKPTSWEEGHYAKKSCPNWSKPTNNQSRKDPQSKSESIIVFGHG
jgi:hypothetical protein